MVALPLLTLGVVLLSAPLALTHPWAFAATCIACILMLRGWRRPRALLLLAVVFALGLYRAETRLATYRAAQEELAVPFRQALKCRGLGVVSSSPRYVDGQFSFTVRVESLSCTSESTGPGHREPPSPLPAGFHGELRLIGGPGDLCRGDLLDFSALLSIPQLFRNGDAPGTWGGAARRAVDLTGRTQRLERRGTARSLSHFIDQARNHVRSRIIATYGPAASPLARALVLGEEDLPDEDSAAFRDSGLSHLLAVSGTHLVFAVLSLVMALKGLLLRLPALACRFEVERLACAAGIPLALLYADFAGGSGSAWRAAWMLTHGFALRAFGRRSRGALALAGSLVIAAWDHPLAVFDLSLLLSVAATTGLLTLGQRWTQRVERLRWAPLRWLLAPMAMTLASLCCCAPLLALLGPKLSLSSLLTNVLAGPVGEAASLPLALVHGCLAPLPFLEEATARAASGSLLLVRALARLGQAYPLWSLPLAPPSPWHWATLAVIAAGASHCRGRARWSLYGGGLLLLAWWELLLRCPPTQLRITAWDVGQGDSLLLEFPNGRTAVVDTGGFLQGIPDTGERVILPELRARRISTLDFVILTHPHPDHLGGLVSLLHAIPVRELWLDDGPLPPTVRDALRGAPRPPVLRRASDLCRATPRQETVQLELLAPCGAEPAEPGNNRSLVVRLTFGTQRALLVGDAEQVEERWLMANRGDSLAATLLKVGHHGSTTSTGPAFLAAVSPRLAVISAGRKNRFDHPRRETLQTLQDAGVLVAGTYQFGAVTWVTNGTSSWWRGAETR